MNPQKKRFTLIRLKTMAANAYFEQLCDAAPLDAITSGVDDWAGLMTQSMPELIGRQLLRCRHAGCSDEQLRHQLDAGKKIAISNFRHAQKQASSADKPT